jgi:hypothetical protein
MVLKRVCQFVLCASLLVAGSALADEYRADEFLGLDLSKAVLSPKRLGPPTEFAPVAVEARNDASQARAEPKADRKIVVRTTRVLTKNVMRTTHVMPKNNVAAARPRVSAPKHQVAAAKPRMVARSEIARRHTNPLDAQAMDTRIQVWPCKSGGICDWKR